MTNIGSFFKENWQLTLIGLGGLMLIGAIFNINFIIDRQGSNPTGFLSIFGEKGYRIMIGIISVLLIAYGALSLIGVPFLA